MRYRTAIVCLLVCLLTGSLYAQENLSGAAAVKRLAPVVDSIYRWYAEKNHSPAMVYGIVMNGRFVHTGYLGFSNLEKKYSADGASAFRIASMTKSVVAVAILQLRDRGKITLDEPASKYIPELKQVKQVTTDAAPITIRNLLTHSAGFPEDNPWGDRQLEISNEDMLAMFRRGISMSNNPGAAFEYSNMGFAMLGYIIKKVTGASYQVYINEHIFKPLGMTHTYWEYNNVPEKNLAVGYRFVDGKWVKQPMLHDGAYGAMGGLITTLDDFQKYLSFHLDASIPKNGAETGPLKRSSIRELHQPWQFQSLNASARRAGGQTCATVSAYGYGLRWAKDCEDRVTIGHSGGLPGFGSNWTIMPAYGLGIICFSNVTYAPAATMNMRVLDTIITLAHLQPSKIPVSDILEQRKNELIKILPGWNAGPMKDIFAVNFFDDYFIDSLKRESAAIFKEAGKIVRVAELMPENNLRGSFILAGERANVLVSFTLSPEMPAKIQAFKISIQENDVHNDGIRPTINYKP